MQFDQLLLFFNPNYRILSKNMILDDDVCLFPLEYLHESVYTFTIQPSEALSGSFQRMQYSHMVIVVVQVLSVWLRRITIKSHIGLSSTGTPHKSNYPLYKCTIMLYKNARVCLSPGVCAVQSILLSETILVLSPHSDWSQSCKPT